MEIAIGVVSVQTGDRITGSLAIEVLGDSTMSELIPYPNVRAFVNGLQSRELDFENPVASAEPVVSIISSFYNVRDYFEQSYRTVIQQTFQNFEWIIVNDCSTDPEAIALFESLPERSPKIRTFHHDTNRGLAAGRNTAIQHARGRYLFFMDLDDLLDPTCIEKFVLFLETHPEFSFVSSYSVLFHDRELLWIHGFHEPAEFLDRNGVTGRILYRKADFDELGGFDEDLRFYEDWERWLKAIANDQIGWTIPEFLDCYRHKDKSGLLASAKQNVEEERRVSELMRSRYRDAFETREFSEIVPTRPDFDVRQLRFQFDFENPLDRANEGKRILCFVPQMKVGGSDKFNLDLFGHLQHRGYDLTIAITIPTQHDWYWQFHEITPDIFCLPNCLHDLHWLAFARYIIQSRQIDIVFLSNSYFAYYLLPFLQHEFPDVAFIDYTHTDDPGSYGIGYPRVSCQLAQFLDTEVVASQYLANYYQQLNPETRDKLRVCRINVDTQKWQRDFNKREEIRDRLGISPDAIAILFPARIVPQKRPFLFVDIIAKLVERNLPVVAIILGSDYLYDEMQAKIDKLDLQDTFRILPSATPDEVIGFYSASDILLLPSEYEGISLAIYEAMSVQVPVVAADVGGQAELVTPETGFLVPKGQGDAAEVEAYLNVLVSLVEDANLRDRVGKAARERVVRHFPLAAMVNRMEDIFAEARQLAKTHTPPDINPVLAEESLIWFLEYFEFERRMASQWQKTQSWVEELQKHRDWLEEKYRQEGEQSRQWIQELQTQLERSRDWIEQLEASRNWFESQYQSWKETAQQRQEEIERSQQWNQDLQTQLEQSRQWVEQLEASRNWFESQYQNWKQTAEQTRQELEQARDWSEQLQAGRDWFESQLREWQKSANYYQGELEKTRAELERVQGMAQAERDRAEQLESIITAMESSKFWQARSAWFKLKQRLGLEVED